MFKDTRFAVPGHPGNDSENPNHLPLNVHFPVYEFESVEIDAEGEIIKKKRA